MMKKDRSFHHKSYIFHYRDHDELYIGSSNLSRSALTSGIEWNYKLVSLTDEASYMQFLICMNDYLITIQSLLLMKY